MSSYSLIVVPNIDEARMRVSNALDAGKPADGSDIAFVVAVTVAMTSLHVLAVTDKDSARTTMLMFTDDSMYRAVRTSIELISMPADFGRWPTDAREPIVEEVQRLGPGGYEVKAIADSEQLETLLQRECSSADVNSDRLIRIDYTNYRGERGVREIEPREIRWTTSAWHGDEPQWILLAWDVHKDAMRELALNSIHSFTAT